MRRARIALLLTLLLVVAGVYYFQRAARVRVETVQFESRVFGRVMPYDVVLPPSYDIYTNRKKRYAVLYLLHGWGGNHSSWLSNTSLKTYAALHKLIVVTPEGGNGWYTDSATVTEEKFETYFVEELIPDVERRFRAIAARNARSVAGNSMGGYGALKFGLKHPELFAFIGSTSGAFDAASRTDDDSIMRAFGPAASDTRAANDIFKLAREFPAERKGTLPYLYFDCGARDPWFASNRALSDVLLERQITHEFRELPGEHIWPYWDRQLQEILRLAEELATPP
jgi:putative tributyrin esterase